MKKVLNLSKNKPNIILITLDAFSFEIFEKRLSFLPNFNNIIKNSVYFKNAFSVGPSTFFAFPGIIGGTYPYHFGVGLHKNVKSISDILKENSYKTAIINESNALLTPYYGYCKKFDYQNHFLELSHSKIDKNLKSVFLNKKNRRKIDLIKINEKILRKIKNNSRNKIINKFGNYLFNILKFIKIYLFDNNEKNEQRKLLFNEFKKEIGLFIEKEFESPQFLWIHTIVNHLPYLPSEKKQKFSESEIDYLNSRGISGLVNKKVSKKLKSLYMESINLTDELIGYIFDNLKNSDKLENSIVIITADHGEEFMEEGFFGHNDESSSDRIIHVPLIFYYPVKFPQKKCIAPVSTIDIFSTVMDFLEMDKPFTNMGVSLKEILVNDKHSPTLQKLLWQRPIYSEAWVTKDLLDRDPGYFSKKKIFTVRKSKYKMKIIDEAVKENKKLKNLNLTNWVTKEELNLNDNIQIVDEYLYLFYLHLHQTSSISKRIHKDIEKNKIKDIMKKNKNKFL